MEEETVQPKRQLFWTTKKTKLLLKLYNDRRNKFKDPKIKKKNLWIEIVGGMKKAGYENLDEDMVDRKLRNMKKTYRTIKNNNKRNKNGRSRICWEYYDTFEKIFANDAAFNLGSADPLEMPSSENEDASQSRCEESDSPSRRRRKELHTYRRTLMAVEKERIKAIDRLTETIRESNEIQSERNELLKRYLGLEQVLD